MNLFAIVRAVLLAFGLGAVLVLTAAGPGTNSLSAPQTLSLFALWLVPGFYAGIRAAEAGTLHGLLTGLLGMPILSIGLDGLGRSGFMPTGVPLETHSLVMLTILAAFWAAMGGMLADMVRLIRARRKARRDGDSAGEPPA